MAATYDLSASPQSGRVIVHSAAAEYRKQSFDISKLATHAAGDIVKIIAVNAGEFVRNVYVRVITASTTSSSTVTVGDTASGTSWIASLAATSAAGTVVGSTGSNIFTQSGTTPFAVTWVGGKQYTTADTIQVVLGATPPLDGILEVIVEVVETAIYGTVV